MRLFLSLVLTLLVTKTWATESIKILTPRGTEVLVTTHIPDSKNLPVLLVAPGQSCNSKGPLFEALGVSGLAKNYAVFRFEWSYCGTNNPHPEAGLKNEIEDMK